MIRPSASALASALALALASALLSAAVVLLPANSAAAFPYVVREGDSLAQIAERMYGDSAQERVLVTANMLDVEGGSRIVPGMLLEIPTIRYYVVKEGELWPDLATRLLGSRRRAGALAQANETHPWLPPDEGAEIVVPYNLRVIWTGQQTLGSLGDRFLGDSRRAWVIHNYNQLTKKTPKRGDVILIPLPRLTLSDEGLEAARSAEAPSCAALAGARHQRQAKAKIDIDELIATVERGAYVEAVAAGSWLLNEALSRPQRASVYRQLTIAYAALGDTNLAAQSCGAWIQAEPETDLDPTWVSPKVLSACGVASDGS
jgi:hypothetical protein